MAGPPSVPSTADIVGQQQGANAANIGLEANASNVSGPLGSTNYVSNGQGGYTQVNKLSPAEQQLFNTYAGALQPGALAGAGGALGGISGSTGGSFSPNLVGQGNTLAQQYATQATEAVMPNMEWMIQNQQNDLANQGLFQSTNTNTPNNAADRAMQNMYAGLGQSISGFQSQLLPQAVQAEQMQQYTDPMQAMAQLMQAGAPSLPNQPSSPLFSSSAPNVGAIQGQQQQAQANAFGSTVGGIGSLAGALTNGGTAGFGGSLLGALFA